MAGELLHDADRRAAMQRELATVVTSLGGTGASQRSAQLIWENIQ